MVSIAIKDAIPEDATGITEVRYKTWRIAYPRIYSGITQEDVDRKFADFEGLVKQMRRGIEANNNKNKKFIVAKDKDAIVGFIIASRVKDEPREIKALYVLESYQGQGIGKRLIIPALQWLNAEKYQIIVEVISTNEPAINFYKNSGFRKSRDLPVPNKIDAPDGIPIPHIEMIRKPASIE